MRMATTSLFTDTSALEDLSISIGTSIAKSYDSDSGNDAPG
jgi:hypothetical protein